MPGPNSIPNGTLRPKVNVTKRSIKIKAHKMRVPRSWFDAETGMLKTRA